MAMRMAKVTIPKEPGGKGLHHLEVHPPNASGHTIVKHMMHGPEISDPQEHAFGPEEGHEALMHVAKHAGIKTGEGGAEESPHGASAENDEVE